MLQTVFPVDSEVVPIINKEEHTKGSQLRTLKEIEESVMKGVHIWQHCFFRRTERL